jgi:hypothetical protein
VLQVAATGCWAGWAGSGAVASRCMLLRPAGKHAAWANENGNEPLLVAVQLPQGCCSCAVPLRCC